VAKEKWEEIKQQYEARGKVTIQGKTIGDNGRLKDMLSYVPFPESFKDKRVIDIGCAGGWWSYLAEERGAVKVVAVDNNNTMLKIAEANRPEGSKVEFVQMDVMNLRLGDPPFDKPFDIALFSAILHYMEKPERAIEHVASMLKPNGRCLVETYVKDCAQPGPSIYKYQPSSQQLSKLLSTQFGRLTPFTYRPGSTPAYTRAALWAEKRGGVFVFLTGASGTGKTFLLTNLMERHPDWRIVRPDIEMGLQEEKGVRREQRWGRDFDSFFAVVVPQAIRDEEKVIILEAVMPSAIARQNLLKLVPSGWRKICIILDFLPNEFEAFCPYWNYAVWQANLPVFHHAAPWRRTEQEPYDAIINLGPYTTPQNLALIERIVSEFS